jgi:hypothetical protein
LRRPLFSAPFSIYWLWLTTRSVTVFVTGFQATRFRFNAPVPTKTEHIFVTQGFAVVSFTVPHRTTFAARFLIYSD